MQITLNRSPIPGKDGGRAPKSLPARPAEPEGLHATAQTQQSATGPTPQRCWIWEPVGVFALRSGLFPSTAAIATRFPGLLSASKAVLAVWRRPRGKDGEGFATRRAKAASCPDPVVLFVVGLLAPLAVADDGMVPAARAASWQQGQRKRMHLECGLVSRLRQCDKENQGWREGPPLTVSCQVPIRGGPSPSPAYPFQTKEEYCLLRLTANPPALNFGRYKAVSREFEWARQFLRVTDHTNRFVNTPRLHTGVSQEAVEGTSTSR